MDLEITNKRNELDEWRMPRTTVSLRKTSAINFFASPVSKWVTIDLREGDQCYPTHESLDYYKIEDFNQNDDNNDSKNLDYLPVSSRNLKKLNCRTNRSTSQESLVGAMMKGTSFKIVYPNNEAQKNHNDTFSETSEYFNVNPINSKIAATINNRQCLVTQKKKLWWISLLSPTLSLFDGSLHNGNEKDKSKVIYWNNDNEDLSSLIHWSTNES